MGWCRRLAGRAGAGCTGLTGDGGDQGEAVAVERRKCRARDLPAAVDPGGETRLLVGGADVVGVEHVDPFVKSQSPADGGARHRAIDPFCCPYVLTRIADA